MLLNSAAPEAFRINTLTSASDIYSLGLVIQDIYITHLEESHTFHRSYGVYSYVVTQWNRIIRWIMSVLYLIIYTRVYNLV